MILREIHSQQKFGEIWNANSVSQPKDSRRFLHDESVRQMFGDPPSLKYYAQRYPALMRDIGNVIIEFASQGDISFLYGV